MFWIQRIDFDQTLKGYTNDTGITTFDSSVSLTASLKETSPILVMEIPSLAEFQGVVDYEVSKKDYGPLLEPGPSDQF